MSFSRHFEQVWKHARLREQFNAFVKDRGNDVAQSRRILVEKPSETTDL